MIVGFVVSPAGLNGGAGATGSIRLNQTAPPGGLVVKLSSSDAATTVPASVAVPAGATTAVFPVETERVPRDVSVEVLASDGRRTWSAALQVWSAAANSFSVVGDPGDFVGAGRVYRFTAPPSRFVAQCVGSLVRVQVDGGRWSADVGAAPGTPLRPGTYEGARGFPPSSGPTLRVSGDGRACNEATGRFVVEEADLTAAGDVRRLSVTFEQRCSGSPATLRGEIRLTDARSDGSVTSCVR